MTDRDRHRTTATTALCRGRAGKKETEVRDHAPRARFAKSSNPLSAVERHTTYMYEGPILPLYFSSRSPYINDLEYRVYKLIKFVYKDFVRVKTD